MLQEDKGFRPNDGLFAISLSLMFEGGGQPISSAGGVIPEMIEGAFPTCQPMPLLCLWPL